MKRVGLASAAAALLALIACWLWPRDERGFASAGPGPEARAPVPSVQAIRALARVPETATRSSALPAPETAEATNATGAVDPARKVRCLVLDGDGKPRATTTVFWLRAQDTDERDAELVNPETSEFLGESRTGEDGRSEFQIETLEGAFVCCIVEKERVHVAAWVDEFREVVLRFPHVDSGDFEIEVVTQAGDSVPEYELLAYSRSGNQMGFIAQTQVRSADGRIRCAVGNRLSRSQELLVKVLGPVEFEPISVGYSYDEAQDGRVHRIELVEKKGGTRGIVVTKQGAPIDGARVTWAETRAGNPLVSASSNPRGEFMLDAKASRDRGYLCVRAERHPLFLSAMTDVPVSVAGELRVEIETGAVLEGLVTIDGKPAPDAFVIAWIASHLPQGFGLGGFDSGSATTDESGRYRVEGLARGWMFVAVQPAAVKHGLRRYYAGVQRVEIVAAHEEHDVRLTTGITVRGSLEFDRRPNAALFLQLFDSREPTIPWSTATAEVGKDFELALPRSSDATLRIWMNPSALCSIPIPASNGPIDLGEIELTKDRFRPFDGK